MQMNLRATLRMWKPIDKFMEDAFDMDSKAIQLQSAIAEGEEDKVQVLYHQVLDGHLDMVTGARGRHVVSEYTKLLVALTLTEVTYGRG